MWASGGLAAVSQQSRSTTWSLTRRLKHSVAGWASTWTFGRTCLVHEVKLFWKAYALEVVRLHEYTYSYWLHS
jgi:hypothetical protein